MASKWRFLKGKYERAPLGKMSEAADPTFIEKVAAYKSSEYATYDQIMLQDLHEEINREKDELAEVEKDLNARLEAISQMLLERFENQGVTSVKTTSGQTLYESIEPYVSVINKEEFYNFVRSDAALAYMWSVHPGVLGSFVKSLLEEGRDAEIPTSLKVYLKSSIRSRKG